MKVRLEIIDEDGTESTNVEFGGRHWKKRLLAFLDTVEDETDFITEPSSISSNSKVQLAEQNVCPQQFVQQQVPFNQQPVQHAVPQQQFQPVQQPQVQTVSQQYPPVQQAAMTPQYHQLQQQVMQSQTPFIQQPPVYSQQPVMQNYPNYNVPQYVQSNLPPVGLQQYGFEQPARAMTSTVHPPVNTSSQAQPAVSYLKQPVRRKATMLQERLNDMSLTINERLELFLKYEYPRVWFSSHDVQQHYERIYGEIKQSTVSTYLSRMFRKNLLERRGNRTQREYRYIGDEKETPVRVEEMPEVPVSNRFYY